ncbi:MAG TPA: hypothetical protein VHV78_08600 [Gemmatimonadaceae bacterium]|nr:hypothetical protein [Gemmatimonadaceae bacterium]
MTGARFELIESAGQTSGQLDVRFRDGTSVDGIAVDILAAARNDERALTYPDAELRAFLLPYVRLLVHRRVVPLEATLRFEA